MDLADFIAKHTVIPVMNQKFLALQIVNGLTYLHAAGTVRVFRRKSMIEDAIGSHACSLQASRRVTNGIPLGCPSLSPVYTAICVQPLKVSFTVTSSRKTL
jgi:hypothetical protein